MDRKVKILIGILIIVVALAVVVVVLTTVNYEKLYVTPNGTNLDVPANKTQSRGQYEGVKIWTWDHGAVVTYNSHEGSGINKITGLSYSALNDVVKKGQQERIDNLTCYVINADDILQVSLFNIIKVNYNGKLYCFSLANESSHDNIIICCKDRDVAIHMAKSVEYKNVYPEPTDLDKAISKVGNFTGDLKSKADNLTNGSTLNGIKNTIEDKAGDVQSKAGDYVNNVNLSKAESEIHKIIPQI